MGRVYASEIEMIAQRLGVEENKQEHALWAKCLMKNISFA